MSDNGRGGAEGVIAEDVIKAVSEALESGNFSEMNRTLREVTGSAADTAVNLASGLMQGAGGRYAGRIRSGQNAGAGAGSGNIRNNGRGAADNGSGDSWNNNGSGGYGAGYGKAGSYGGAGYENAGYYGGAGSGAAGSYGGTGGGNAGYYGGNSGQGYGGGRVYGHAGRYTRNVTEEYMNRAPGAGSRTKFMSRISPFLQRQVSRSSGNGKIIGGIVSFVAAGFSLIGAASAGLAGAVFSAVPVFGLFASLASGMGVLGLAMALGLGVLGGILIRGGNERKRLVRKYYEYGRVAGSAEYVEISKLAQATGESRENVIRSLEQMMEQEMLPAAWFDRQKSTLMLSERIYNEYLRLERERQAQAQEEKERLKREASEKGARGSAEKEAAGDSIPEDLKLLPEDQKLPAEARRIVEEGLLYIGRVRESNREIGDEEISMQLARLEVTLMRIIEQIRKDPSCAQNLRRLMVYYLPTTMKLLDAYGELDRQPMEGGNIASTKREIREAMGTVNEAFENLLDSLFQDMAWDISSDISVMKTMMAQDGLTGDGIRSAAGGSAEGAADSAAVGQDGRTEGGSAGGPADSGEKGYTDGYTEGFTEDFEEGAAAAQAAQPDEDRTGIRLTFGE